MAILTSVAEEGRKALKRNRKRLTGGGGWFEEEKMV